VKSAYSCVTGIVVLAACVFVFGEVGDSALSAAQSKPPASGAVTPAGKSRKPAGRGPRFHDYQVAAGSAVSIELRTRLSSNGSQPADAIEGRLLRPLVATNGVELVPAGATVLGTVSEAEPAGLRRPGRLAFTFQIIEHPETGSRATIKTATLTFESQPPAKGNLFADIRIEKGADASVLLLAPLLVSIPVEH
jgi:hypothetical protein